MKLSEGVEPFIRALDISGDTRQKAEDDKGHPTKTCLRPGTFHFQPKPESVPAAIPPLGPIWARTRVRILGRIERRSTQRTH